jgi:4-coumarate--CoA ligase
MTVTPPQLASVAPPGSVGSLIANCYARIVDDNEKDVEPGEPGELWVKGPVITKGYWKNDKANKDAFRGDWFCTGDIAVFRDGYFFIVDRKKASIRRVSRVT